MYSAFVAIILFLAVCGPQALDAAKLPDTFEKCHVNDPKLAECLKSAIQHAIRDTKPGIPSLQLFPTDPLEITSIVIQEGVGRPVNIKLNLTNVKSNGLSTAEIQKVTPDLAKRTLEVNAFVPFSFLEGDYDMDGKFLVLPMRGTGKAKMEFTGMHASLKLVAEPKTKKEKEYWNVMSFETHVKDMDKLAINFDNLFNGDKRLGDNTNKVLNENWKAFWEELRPSFEETFGTIFLQLAKKIFDKVPSKEIFLD